MNYLEVLRRVFRTCLTLIAGALALLSIVACGIFWDDEAATSTLSEAATPSSTSTSSAVTTPSSTSAPSAATTPLSTSTSDQKPQATSASVPTATPRPTRTPAPTATPRPTAAPTYTCSEGSDPTPLHRAVDRNNIEVVRILASLCPGDLNVISKDKQRVF